MGGKDEVISLPDPPKPRRSMLKSIFGRRDDHSTDIKTIQPVKKKKKGFILPHDEDFEKLQYRHLQHIGNLRRRLDHDTRERHAYAKEKEYSLELKEKELAGLQHNLKTQQKRVERTKADIYEKLRIIEEKEKSVSEREKIVRTEEKDFAKDTRLHKIKITKLKNGIEELSRVREHLMEEVLMRRRDVEEINKEYSETAKTLRENEKLLSMREDEILVSVKKLEDDKNILDEKEDEILKQVKKIEDDTKLLTLKEDEILSRFKKLELEKQRIVNERKKFDNDIERSKEGLEKKEAMVNARVAKKTTALNEKKKMQMEYIKQKFNELKKRESEIKKIEQDLAKKLDKVNHSKELKENTKRVEKFYAKLITDYTALKSDYLKTMTLRQKEKELHNLHAELIKRSNRLREINDDLNNRKHVIDDMEYKNYSAGETARSGFPYMHRDVEMKVPRAVKSNDIFTMIEDTKGMIENGSMEDAQHSIRRINKLFAELELSKEQKSVLYYDILELQNAIEIALL